MNRFFSLLYRKVIKFVNIFDRKKYKLLYVNYLRMLGVKVEGNPRWISDDLFVDPEGYDYITIGDLVTISRGCTILVHDYSPTNFFWLEDDSIETVKKKDYVSIGKGCFIGANTTLLAGSEIGENSIIAAGSVVTGIVPPNSVYGGVPARFIQSTEEYIGKVKLRDFEKIEITKRKKD